MTAVLTHECCRHRSRRRPRRPGAQHPGRRAGFRPRHRPLVGLVSGGCPHWRALPRHVHVLRIVRARHEPPGAGRRRGLPRGVGAGRREQAKQLRCVQRADGALRRHLLPRARRPGAASPVLRRRGSACRRERAEGGVRLEEPAQRGPRHRPGAGHQGAAPARRVPRPQRLHAVADQHRPEQGRPVPEVRLAANRRALHPARREHGRAGSRIAAPGPCGVRSPPARHRLLHRRADPG